MSDIIISHCDAEVKLLSKTRFRCDICGFEGDLPRDPDGWLSPDAVDPD